MRRFETTHTFDANALIKPWRQLDLLESEMEAAETEYKLNKQALTRRRLDCSNGAGVNAYIMASGLIGTARENQKLLERTIMTHGVGVSPQATPNIIRPALEAAAWALWIIDGKDAQDRRLRGLQRSWEDHRQSNNWLEELKPMLDSNEQEQAEQRRGEISACFREKARLAGIEWARVTKQVSLTDELKKLSLLRSDETIRRTVVATWRKLSGVQHGFSYAALLSSSHEDRHAVPVEGGWEVTLVSDDNSLLTDCQVSAFMQLSAMKAYTNATRLS
ncbi:hypothetical protein ACSDQ9_13335 [Aestuariimicrobium soli]|uniref:hypothetical protein n=1 Tax=Aestuariimicrobium soli TaxID=2035834 RepID=UPI003EB8BCD4